MSNVAMVIDRTIGITNPFERAQLSSSKRYRKGLAKLMKGEIFRK